MDRGPSSEKEPQKGPAWASARQFQTNGPVQARRQTHAAESRWADRIGALYAGSIDCAMVSADSVNDSRPFWEFRSDTRYAWILGFVQKLRLARSEDYFGATSAARSEGMKGEDAELRGGLGNDDKVVKAIDVRRISQSVRR